MAPELVARRSCATSSATRPERVFATWDPMPIAAASIGQVHRARTHDGRDVAVKVQYPGVDDAIRADLDERPTCSSARSGCMFPGLDPGPLVDELRARLVEELDYRIEADEPAAVRRLLRRPSVHPRPGVIDELSTARVLTTELAEGARFAEVEQLVTGGARPRGRGDLPVRVPQPLPPARVQRRPAPGQLPVPARRSSRSSTSAW